MDYLIKLIFVLLLSAGAYSQTVDRIAVIVNDGVVLESDIQLKIKNFKKEAAISGARVPSEEDLRNNHLIVFGDTKSNTLLKRIMEKQNALPFEWNKESLMIKGNQYDAASHVPVLIYPNPLNSEKYIVLNSGPTHREGHDRTNSLQNPKLPDWSVIDLSLPPNDQVPGKVIEAGFFNEAWK